MEIIIRKTDWKTLDKSGIPKDNADVMEYFNNALDNDDFPLVPRHDKITTKEIKKLWVLNKDINITYVAVDKEKNKVIGSCTYFTETNRLAVTVQKNYWNQGIGTKLTKEVIDDALSKNIKVHVYVPIEHKPMNHIMEKLGYKPERKIHNHERFYKKIKAKSFDVYEYII
jgi:RimJ/RimL family protein N-acetyltransferase